MLAADRDLLVTEPSIFRDVAWTAQQLVDGTGTLAGTTLTIPGIDLESLGVDAGCVVAADGLPLEVVARTSPTTLTVSRLRADAAGAPIPPVPFQDRRVTVHTFRHQLARASARVLRMCGIEPEDPGGPGEAAITNRGALVELTALLALADIYAGAEAAGGPAGLGPRSEAYRRRAAAARALAGVRLDLDGDGIADATRHACVRCLDRA